jgi:hypothetical protein
VPSGLLELSNFQELIHKNIAQAMAGSVGYMVTIACISMRPAERSYQALLPSDTNDIDEDTMPTEAPSRTNWNVLRVGGMIYMPIAQLCLSFYLLEVLPITRHPT